MDSNVNIIHSTSTAIGNSLHLELSLANPLSNPFIILFYLNIFVGM